MSQRVAGVPPVVATGEPDGWEIIFYVYTMISLNSSAFLSLNQSRLEPKLRANNSVDFSNHQQWNHQSGWKNTLNNLRLITQPLFLFWLVYPWLDIFPRFRFIAGIQSPN